MSKLLKYIFIPVIAFAIFYFCSASSFAAGQTYTINSGTFVGNNPYVSGTLRIQVFRSGVELSSFPVCFIRSTSNPSIVEIFVYGEIITQYRQLINGSGSISNSYHPTVGGMIVSSDLFYCGLVSFSSVPSEYVVYNGYDDFLNATTSSYDDTIGDFYLTKSLFYYRDSTRESFDAMCTLWAFGAANVVGIPIVDKLDYNLYLNDVLVDTFTEYAVPFFPISEVWDTKFFLYSHYDAEPGDVFRCELIPYKSNGDFGKTSSISWTVELTHPMYNGITDNPNVEPYKVVQDVPIEPFITPQVTTITAPNLPPQNITYYTTNYTTEVVVDTSKITSILDDINAKLDLIVSSTPEPNEPYEWKINFGSNSQEQYDKGKGHIKEWGDNVTSYLGLLVGTPFEDIFDSIVTYIAVIGGIAFVLVAIKVVGLIL